MTGHELARAVRIGDYPEMLRRKDTKRLQTRARDCVKAIVSEISLRLPISRSSTNCLMDAWNHQLTRVNPPAKKGFRCIECHMGPDPKLPFLVAC